MDVFFNILQNFGAPVTMLAVLLFFNYRLFNFVKDMFFDKSDGIAIKWFNKQMETMDKISATQVEIVSTLSKIQTEVIENSKVLYDYRIVFDNNKKESEK